MVVDITLLKDNAWPATRHSHGRPSGGWSSCNWQYVHFCGLRAAMVQWAADALLQPRLWKLTATPTQWGVLPLEVPVL